MEWPSSYNTGYSPGSGYPATGYSSELTPIEPSMSSHLPTVLPDTPVSSHVDYSMFNLKSSSPDTLECGGGGGGGGGTVTALQPATHRYDSGYSGAGGYWGGSCTAPAPQNYNYYNSASPAPATQGYHPPPPPPPVMFYHPSLYSTVNQNQIHLHLHHNESAAARSEYNEDLSTLVGNNLTISSGGSRAIEIGILQHNQLPSEDVNRQQNDPSVWRPY
ncbi:hypothetical protein J6590_011421 [Homalodisca vitripennis]|nr:hypothetical protein J6590_011421 [Homalodisca vitripennis]